jgi:hypothetical protein
MTRKLLMAVAVVAIAFTLRIGIGPAEAHGGSFHGGGFHGGGFHGGGFHHGGFRGGFVGGVFLGDPYFGTYPYPVPYAAAPAPAFWYFCPPANAYYPAVPSCPVPWQPVYPQ